MSHHVSVEAGGDRRAASANAEVPPLDGPLQYDFKGDRLTDSQNKAAIARSTDRIKEFHSEAEYLGTRKDAYGHWVLDVFSVDAGSEGKKKIVLVMRGMENKGVVVTDIEVPKGDLSNTAKRNEVLSSHHISEAVKQRVRDIMDGKNIAAPASSTTEQNQRAGTGEGATGNSRSNSARNNVRSGTHTEETAEAFLEENRVFTVQVDKQGEKVLYQVKIAQPNDGGNKFAAISYRLDSERRPIAGEHIIAETFTINEVINYLNNEGTADQFRTHIARKLQEKLNPGSQETTPTPDQAGASGGSGETQGELTLEQISQPGQHIIIDLQEGQKPGKYKVWVKKVERRNGAEPAYIINAKKVGDDGRDAGDSVISLGGFTEQNFNTITGGSVTRAELERFLTKELFDKLNGTEDE